MAEKSKQDLVELSGQDLAVVSGGKSVWASYMDWVASTGIICHRDDGEGTYESSGGWNPY